MKVEQLGNLRWWTIIEVSPEAHAYESVGKYTFDEENHVDRITGRKPCQPAGGKGTVWKRKRTSCSLPVIAHGLKHTCDNNLPVIITPVIAYRC